MPVAAEIYGSDTERWLARWWSLVRLGSEWVRSGDRIERSVGHAQRWARPVDVG